MEETKRINQTKKDILGCLPPEIVQNISLYLTPENLENASTCNKLWNKLLNRSYFWYKKCQVRGYNELKDISISAIYEKYLIRFPLYFQFLFNYNQLQYNWNNDIFTTTSVAGNSFIELHHFDEEILVATNISKNNIFIIDSCTGQIKNTIVLPKRILRLLKYQHLLVIVMLDESGDPPYSFSAGRNKPKYLQVLTIQGELLFAKKLDDISIPGNVTFAVNLQVYKTLIAINNTYGLLHIIDFEKQTVSYKNSKVYSVCFGDELIALGKDNGTIEILDMNYKKLRIFHHGQRVEIVNIQITQDYMITCARYQPDHVSDNDACVWNLKENVRLYTIKRITILRNETCTFSICQDRLIFIKNGIGRNNKKTSVVVLDLSTGNKMFHINMSSKALRTSLSNGHYMFVTEITREHTGGTAHIHSTKSGKKIASINDIYDDAFFFTGCTGLMCYSLRATETKLAYITNKGDLFIRNYEMHIN